jgi:hypothetical protein
MNKSQTGFVLCVLGAFLITYAVAKISTPQFQYASVMESLFSWHSSVLPPQAQSFSYMFWNFYSVFASIIGAVVLLPVGLVVIFWASGQQAVARKEIGIRKSN